MNSGGLVSLQNGFDIVRYMRDAVGSCTQFCKTETLSYHRIAIKLTGRDLYSSAVEMQQLQF